MTARNKVEPPQHPEDNIKVTTEGDELVIRIHLGCPGRPSASNKNMTIATTGGNRPTLGGVMLGVNCYRPLVAAPQPHAG